MFSYHLGFSACSISASTSSDLSVISWRYTGLSSSIISYSYLTLNAPFFFYWLCFLTISFFISGCVFFTFLAQTASVFFVYSIFSRFTFRFERAAFRLKTNWCWVLPRIRMALLLKDSGFCIWFNWLKMLSDLTSSSTAAVGSEFPPPNVGAPFPFIWLYSSSELESSTSTTRLVPTTGCFSFS